MIDADTMDLSRIQDKVKDFPLDQQNRFIGWVRQCAEYYLAISVPQEAESISPRELREDLTGIYDAIDHLHGLLTKAHSDTIYYMSSIRGGAKSGPGASTLLVSRVRRDLGYIREDKSKALALKAATPSVGRTNGYHSAQSELIRQVALQFTVAFNEEPSSTVLFRGIIKILFGCLNIPSSSADTLRHQITAALSGSVIDELKSRLH